MNLSFRAKIAALTAMFFVSALLLFGAVLLWISDATTAQLFDAALLERAEGIARAPGPMRPPPNPGGPPPDEPDRQPPPPRVRSEAEILQAPRFLTSDGAPIGPPDAPKAWSEALFRKSRRGEPAFGTVTWNGKRLRVVSTPVRREHEGVVGVVQQAADLGALEYGRRAQRTALWLGIPIAALAAVGMAALLTRQIVQPIAALTRLAEQIAESPRAKRRMRVSGDDEIGRLAVSFNTMTDRLQAANERSEQLLETQRRFVSDASHELRTPLTRISLAADNAMDSTLEPKERNRSLEVIRRAALSMGRLVNGLLTLSRADAEQLELSLVEIDLRVPLAEALSLGGFDENPCVRLSMPDEPVMASADADAVQRIVTNLLDNALRAIDGDGRVDVRLVALDLPEIQIEDNGVGIAPELLPHIFERFYRVDAARSAGVGGQGLGLSICETLAKAMRAKITAVSRPGFGSKFSVQFQKNRESS